VLLLALSIAALSQTAEGKPVNGLEPLFQAVMQYRSESESETDAVVAVEGREGAYIGSGDGTVTGERTRGTIRWSLWSGNCVYPLVRKYRVSVTLVFGTEDARYAWLSEVPAVVEGEFDEKAGRATWNVLAPSGGH
jgi:hypothetical protein